MKIKDAAIAILKEKDNLSTSEIYNEIFANGIEIETNGKTPKSTLSAMLSSYSNNPDKSFHYKNIIFSFSNTTPKRYSLIKKENIKTNTDIIKHLVDNGVRCLKIEDTNGNEIESIYLEPNYTWFMKTTEKCVEKNELFLDMFIKLLEK